MTLRIAPSIPKLSDTFIKDLPLPRNVSGAFYIAPGVVSGGGTGTANPSIGGSTGLENNYSADGVTITDQAYGGLGVYTPQYGSLGTGINQTFVKEVDVKTAAFEPKYGLGDGGIVEIVTKSAQISITVRSKLTCSQAGASLAVSSFISTTTS